MQWPLSASIPDLLWKISIQAAIVAMLIWLISRVAAKVPARIRHGLWLLVILKFFVPPFAQFPAGLVFWPQSEPPVLQTEATPTARMVAGSIPPPVGSNSSTPQNLPIHPNAFAVFWLVGVGAMVCGLLIRQGRQELLVRTSQPAESGLLDSFRKCSEMVGVAPVPRLRISNRVPSPLLVGLLRPMVILPGWAAQSENDSRLEAILLHELAHVKLRDMASLWLYQLAKVLFFFHPALWLAGYEMSKEKEFACDEFVISATKVSPRDYAAGYVEALKMSNAAMGMPVCLAMAEPYQVEKTRVERILNRPAPRLGARSVAALVAAAVIAIPTFAGVDHRTAVSAGFGDVSVRAEGSGVVVTLRDVVALGKPVRPVYDSDVRGLAQALTAAGAEAISINGQRYTSATKICCVGPMLSANGVNIAPPYEVKAIGDMNGLRNTVVVVAGKGLPDGMVAVQEIQHIKIKPLREFGNDKRSSPPKPADRMYSSKQVRGISAEAFLERMLDPEPGYWKFAALNALAQKAKESNRPARTSILALVTDAMHDKTRPIYQRWQCCYVLRDCGDSRAVPDLVDILLHDDNEVMRSVAAEAVGGFRRSAEAREALLQADRQEKSPRVREVLDRHLGRSAQQQR